MGEWQASSLRKLSIRTMSRYLPWNSSPLSARSADRFWVDDSASIRNSCPTGWIIEIINWPVVDGVSGSCLVTGVQVIQREHRRLARCHRAQLLSCSASKVQSSSGSADVSIPSVCIEYFWNGAKWSSDSAWLFAPNPLVLSPLTVFQTPSANSICLLTPLNRPETLVSENRSANTAWHSDYLNPSMKCIFQCSVEISRMKL